MFCRENKILSDYTILWFSAVWFEVVCVCILADWVRPRCLGGWADAMNLHSNYIMLERFIEPLLSLA